MVQTLCDNYKIILVLFHSLWYYCSMDTLQKAFQELESLGDTEITHQYNINGEAFELHGQAKNHLAIMKFVSNKIAQIQVLQSQLFDEQQQAREADEASAIAEAATASRIDELTMQFGASRDKMLSDLSAQKKLIAEQQEKIEILTDHSDTARQALLEISEVDNSTENTDECPKALGECGEIAREAINTIDHEILS